MLKKIAPALAFVWACIVVQVSFAHDGQPPEPHDLWTAWNGEPSIILGLALVGWVYLKGWKRMQRRAELRPAELDKRGAFFLMGWVVLFVALISPLDPLATALFSAHMAQHMLLILVAPPLLILGVPLTPLLLGTPVSVRNFLGASWQRTRWLHRLWKALSHPLLAWSIHVIVVWVWHSPLFYEASLQNEWVHMLQHLSFLGTALIFWWGILYPQGNSQGESSGILALFTMALQGGLLGALITFAQTSWYPAYAETTQPWGLSPLEDQQLAGAIMWIPAGTVYTLATLLLFMKRLGSIERNAQQREAR